MNRIGPQFHGSSMKSSRFLPLSEPTQSRTKVSNGFPIVWPKTSHSTICNQCILKLTQGHVAFPEVIGNVRAVCSDGNCTLILNNGFGMASQTLQGLAASHVV